MLSRKRDRESESFEAVGGVEEWHLPKSHSLEARL